MPALLITFLLVLSPTRNTSPQMCLLEKII
jgi:hypothetical protein